MNGRRAVTVSPQEAQRSSALFEVRPSQYGMGLFAKQDVPRLTLVGTYPGVVLSEREFTALAKRTKLGTYAVQFFKVARNGALDEKWIIVPGDAKGDLRPEFSNAITPFVNEPTTGAANLIWVWNFARGTVEMYTAVGIRAGRELLICYGGDYDRGYKSSCASRPNNALHYKFTADGQPVALRTLEQRSQMLSSLVRNASPSPPDTPAASANRARSPSVNSTNRTRKRTPDNRNSRNSRGVKRLRVTMGRNAWLRDMRALLDKPRLGDQDVRAIHALEKLYPHLANNKA